MLAILSLRSPKSIGCEHKPAPQATFWNMNNKTAPSGAAKLLFLWSPPQEASILLAPGYVYTRSSRSPSSPNTADQNSGRPRRTPGIWSTAQLFHPLKASKSVESRDWNDGMTLDLESDSVESRQAIEFSLSSESWKRVPLSWMNKLTHENTLDPCFTAYNPNRAVSGIAVLTPVSGTCDVLVTFHLPMSRMVSRNHESVRFWPMTLSHNRKQNMLKQI